MTWEAYPAEKISENLTIYRVDDGEIVVYVPVVGDRSTVDTWAQTVIDTVAQWPENRLYLEVHDMRDVAISPYAQKRASELVIKMADVEGRGAIIVPRSFTGDLLHLFVNKIFAPFNKSMQRRIFYDQINALTWLREARAGKNA